MRWRDRRTKDWGLTLPAGRLAHPGGHQGSRPGGGEVSEFLRHAVAVPGVSPDAHPSTEPSERPTSPQAALGRSPCAATNLDHPRHEPVDGAGLVVAASRPSAWRGQSPSPFRASIQRLADHRTPRATRDPREPPWAVAVRRSRAPRRISTTHVTNPPTAPVSSSRRHGPRGGAAEGAKDGSMENGACLRTPFAPPSLSPPPRRRAPSGSCPPAPRRARGDPEPARASRTRRRRARGPCPPRGAPGASPPPSRARSRST
jgi:hypothetical protein